MLEVEAPDVDMLNPAESKRRREERKKKKTLLLEGGYIISELVSDSHIDDIINTPKPKNRRRIRQKTRKNCTEKSLLDEESTSTTIVDFGNNVEVDNVVIGLNKLELISEIRLQCTEDCPKSIKSSAKKTLSKKQKMKKEAVTDLSKSVTFTNSKLNSKMQEPSPKSTNKLRNKSMEIRKENKSCFKLTNFSEYFPQNIIDQGTASGELFKGIIRINPKDYKIGYITNPNKEEPDIALSVIDRNCALEGDHVVIKLKPQSEWKDNQKTAAVVYILEKVHPRTAVGYLKLMPDKNNAFALFHPRDARIPRIRIPYTDWPVRFFDLANEYQKILFLAKITSWTDSRYALGTIVENIGLSSDIKVETTAILAEHCLDVTPFTDEMKKYFPSSGEILEEEYKQRLDLRKECIFTIDPLTARDLDDAVSCKELSNGNYEIGVHISDVTYYLKDDTPLDKIVSRKATSIYMVESVYHMLPKELCMMCSLLSGEDKLAFSVFWEMSPEGKVITHRFSRSVINSCVQLAYEHAQMMIDDPHKKFSVNELPPIQNGYSAGDLSRIVNNLQKIAVILRQSRFESGSLRIDQPKIQFSLDLATCLPLSYTLYENKECHRLIEEFMLLANMTVATRLHSDFPDIAFLRKHAAPKERLMLHLKSALEKVGIHLDISTSGGLQQSMLKYFGDDELSMARTMVINLLCAKPMSRAAYFCANNCNNSEDYWHYALSIPLYTHFTSPIRRYADVMVHRQLAASLGYREKPNWPQDYVSRIANICNRKKHCAKLAGDQSIEMYLIYYIGKHEPVIEDAVVMDVKNNSFDVIVLANGLSVRVYINVRI